MDRKHETACHHGAAEFSRQMDYVLGWDATEEVIEDWMYEALANKFVLDADMQEWLNRLIHMHFRISQSGCWRLLSVVCGRHPRT